MYFPLERSHPAPMQQEDLMEQIILDRFPISRCITPERLLCVLYGAGTLLGMYLECPLEELWQSASREVLNPRDACLVTVLPLLLGSWAVFAFRRAGAYAASMLRGLLLGMALNMAADIGGITLGMLLLFSAILSGCVMLWFLLRRMQLGRKEAWRDWILCLGLELSIGLADAIWVAPFLRRALTF